jgi:hypothetical protein
MNVMKKVILLFVLGLFINSCSDEPQESYEFYLMPVYQVSMPTSCSLNNVSNIIVKYRRPSTCHNFNGFKYESSGFTRTVSIELVKVIKETCLTDGQSVVEIMLPFKPTELGTYHFKFWSGTSIQGEEQYIEHDIEVNY